MIYRLFFLLIGLIYSSESISQDMTTGYNYLETGQYKKAVTYFDSVLEQYPDNKTAKLCYGRAVGLDGDATMASSVFSELAISYPNDFEVKLNYAEALLWNKNYKGAKRYYATLLELNNQSFEANLGYASSLFQLSQYDTALIYIDKALVIKEGNPNALISKKYIQLELANELMNEEKYTEASLLLNNNLTFFKDDKETILKIIDLDIRQKQWNGVINGYQRIIEKTNDSLLGYDGLSLGYHLKGKNRKALSASLTALDLATAKQEEMAIRKATSRYVEALIWNQKYKKASTKIEELLVTETEKNWVLLLRANLNMYKGEFTKSIRDYNQILTTDSSSFNANFGKANALLGFEKHDEAYNAALVTLKHHEDQKEVLDFIEKLNVKFLPSVENKTAVSEDLGANRAVSNNTLITFPLSTKFSLLGDINIRNTSNNTINNEANSSSILGGFTYQFKSYSHLKVKLGSVFTRSVVEDFSRLASDVSLKLRPFKLHSLEIGSVRKYEDFNTDLIEKGIFHNHFYLNYNVNTHFNLGWFTQYYFTIQSDNNIRNLLFTSLYYSVLKKPLVKFGINYQNISFQEQRPTIYFSPDKFHAVEGFVDILKNEKIINNRGLFYGLTAATGLQFIEDNDSQLTYRLNAKLGMKVNKKILFNVYGSHSNIASTTAAGFTITEVGFRVLIHFGNKPVFNYKPIY